MLPLDHAPPISKSPILATTNSMFVKCINISKDQLQFQKSTSISARTGYIFEQMHEYEHGQITFLKINFHMSKDRYQFRKSTSILARTSHIFKNMHQYYKGPVPCLKINVHISNDRYNFRKSTSILARTSCISETQRTY